MEEHYDKYLNIKKAMIKDNISFCATNEISDYEGYLMTGFRGEMVKTVYSDLDVEEKPEREVILKVENGVVIPSISEFEDVTSFFSVWDFCDSLDADIVDTYHTLADSDSGIKAEFIHELGLPEETAFESSIMYIWNIESKDERSLDLFLTLFDDFLVQLPSRGSRIVAVVINKKEQPGFIKIFKENGWYIKAMSSDCGFAYRRIYQG